MKPKAMDKGHRYFEDKVWVEDGAMHIVRSNGKAAPDIRANGAENLFPRFDARRERIDGYWFPSSIVVDDTLQFSTGPMRIHQNITFQNYKQP